MSDDDRPEKAPTRLLIEGGPEVAKRARKVLAASLAEHPAPWRDEADTRGNQNVVVDANGWTVIGPDNMSGIYFASPHVHAQVLAAPEMEALLRHIAAEVLPFEYGRPDGKEGGIAEAAQEILVRIDAAKDGE